MLKCVVSAKLDKFPTQIITHILLREGRDAISNEAMGSLTLLNEIEAGLSKGPRTHSPSRVFEN
jgi:hypothetical protein